MFVGLSSSTSARSWDVIHVAGSVQWPLAEDIFTNASLKVI